MPVMQWSVDYFTGLPEIDRQHEELFALVNRLDGALRDGSETLDRSFADLHAYIREHFALEERFMAEAQLDPAYCSRHKTAHANFVLRVDELWEAYRGGSEAAGTELLGFLVAWLREHILHTDRSMAHDVHLRLGKEAPHNQFSHFLYVLHQCSVGAAATSRGPVLTSSTESPSVTRLPRRRLSPVSL